MDATTPAGTARPAPDERLAAKFTDPASPWAMAWPSGLFVLITFFVGADLAADLSAEMSVAHIGVESVALLIGLTGAWGTGMQLRRSLARAHALEHHLQGTLSDLDRTRQEMNELRKGLGSALDHQFDRWALTAAQREVALLVLKGLSYREIADLRNTAEHTVRNQALAIYRKAGLTNRAEMAAFFLEDLLLPTAESRPGSVRATLPSERGDGTFGQAP